MFVFLFSFFGVCLCRAFIMYTNFVWFYQIFCDCWFVVHDTGQIHNFTWWNLWRRPKNQPNSSRSQQKKKETRRSWKNCDVIWMMVLLCRFAFSSFSIVRYIHIYTFILVDLRRSKRKAEAKTTWKRKKMRYSENKKKA